MISALSPSSRWMGIGIERGEQLEGPGAPDQGEREVPEVIWLLYLANLAKIRQYKIKKETYRSSFAWKRDVQQL